MGDQHSVEGGDVQFWIVSSGVERSVATSTRDKTGRRHISFRFIDW